MATNGLLSAYLIVGTDQLKRERAVHRLKARLEPGLEAFNLDERTASADMSGTDLVLSLDTLPVGQGFRLVLIHDAARLPKAAAEALITYLQNPNPDSLLCLETEALAKTTRLYKALAKVGKQAIVSCDAIKPRDLPDYVCRLARSLRISIDPTAARELVSRVGEDTTLIERTLRTLGEQCGSAIGLAEVEANVARTAEVKPWEFLDKISAGDSRRALELYRHMQNPSHLALVTLLTRRVRDLVCAKSLIDRGKQREIASALGRQEWQVRSLAQAARRFSKPGLTSCLKACATCERELKTGQDEQTSFVRLVLTICAGG